MRSFLFVCATLLLSCRLFDGKEPIQRAEPDLQTYDVAMDVARDVAQDGIAAIEDTSPDLTLNKLDGPFIDASADLPTTDWWDNDFEKRMSVEFSVPAIDQTVLIFVPTAVVPSTQFFEDAQDVRFVQDNVTLNYEFERVTDGLAAWVRVPDLSKNVHMYWGNTGVNTITDPGETWDRYELVFHMDGDRDVTSRGMVADRILNVAFVPGERGFEGLFTDGFLLYGSASFTDVTTANPQLLVEIRFKTAEVVDRFLVWKNSVCAGWSISVERASLWTRFSQTDLDCDSTPTFSFTQEPAIATDEWHYVASHYDLAAGFLTVFSEGEMIERTTINTEGITARDGKFRIGTNWQELIGLNGTIDEVRISRIPPTKEYFDVHTAMFNDSLVSFGPIEERGQ